ncbi:MAG: hypothetical protein DCC75_13245, partial [Proteobacteria bacterium]
GSTSLSLGSTANADVESIALGDLDGDGKLDIVVGGDNDLNDSEVSSFRNLGSQSFATRVSYSYITPHTSTVTEVKLRDINGDGRLDLLANTQKTSGIAAFVLFANLNSGSGQFDSYRSLYADGSEAVTSFDLADMNRDGKLDLMISSSPLVDQPDINIALGNGDGTFKNPTNISSLPDVAISDMQAADINGDGYLDLITGGNDGVQTQINVFLGNGDGTFRAPISRTRAGGSSLSNIEIADLNGDGAMEIIGQETGSILDIFNPTTQLLTTTAYLNLTNRDDALAALSVIDQELTRLNLQQGSYGSMLSRLQVAVGNLESSRLNYLSSYGRIVDADIAQESGALLRNSILQDIGSAILAQAYLSPSLALTLLGV